MELAPEDSIFISIIYIRDALLFHKTQQQAEPS